MKTAGHIKSLSDLIEFSKPVVGYNLYTHAVRDDAVIDQILANGIMPGKNGKVSATPTTASPRGQIDAYRVRAIGSGYVVFKATNVKEVDDVISVNERYPEVEVDYVAPDQIVKVVRMVTDRSGYRIREDILAAYAVKNRDNVDAIVDEIADLPSEYQRWFQFDSDIIKEFVRYVVNNYARGLKHNV